MCKTEEVKDLIRDLTAYLEFQSQMGNGRIMAAVESAPVSAAKTAKQNAKPSKKQPESASGKTSPISVSLMADIFESDSPGGLGGIKDEMGDCKRCKLHSERKTIVFGEGNPKAKIVFVGEGPGKDEDEQGRPFVGRAGKLLDKIINAMGMKREEVYICNVVKCRPPGNRNPEPEEVSSCEPFLIKQIRSVSPEVIVCLGLVAAKALLKLQNPSLGSLRGVFHNYGGTKLIVTYHPAALLRNPAFKKPAWEDMKAVMAEIGKNSKRP